MLGSWLSTVFHAVAGNPVVETAANFVVPGSGEVLAAANTIHVGGKGSSSPVEAPVVIVPNPQNEFLLLAAAGLGVFLLFQKPHAAAPAPAVGAK